MCLTTIRIQPGICGRPPDLHPGKCPLQRSAGCATVRMSPPALAGPLLSVQEQVPSSSRRRKSHSARTKPTFPATSLRTGPSITLRTGPFSTQILPGIKQQRMGPKALDRRDLPHDPGPGGASAMGLELQGIAVRPRGKGEEGHGHSHAVIAHRAAGFGAGGLDARSET